MKLEFIINHSEYIKLRLGTYEHNISSLFSELGKHIKGMVNDLGIKVLITFNGTHTLELSFIDKIEAEVVLVKMLIQKFKHINLFKIIEHKENINVR